MQKSASNKLKQQKEKSNAKKRKIMTSAEIALEDLTQTSSVEYTDVYSDADLRYDINSSQLKESIILHKKPNNHTAYSYLLRTEGLHPVLQSDGSIRIFETKDTEQSEPVFLLPAPYMYDSADVVSYEIETTLEKQDDGYLLTYRPNTEWLREKCGYIATSSFTLYVGELDLKTAPSNNIVFVDGTYDFNIGNTTGSNDSNYNWQTGNSSIATVNSTGILTGVSAGTAIITAVSKNDSSIYCRFSVKIKKTKSYVFYLGKEDDDFTRYALAFQTDVANQYYSGKTEYIELISMKNATNFKNQWNNMGEIGYEIGYIAIICHASAEEYSSMEETGGSTINCDEIRETFEPKTIEGLITSGCNAGHLDHDTNLGVVLSETVNGAPVLAADGTVDNIITYTSNGLNYDLRFRCLYNDGFINNLKTDRTSVAGWILYQKNNLEEKRIRTGYNEVTLLQLLEVLNYYNADSE